MLYAVFALVASVIGLGYFLILSVSLIPLRKSPANRPGKVSVIIAAKDEPLLERTLKNLLRISCPKLEIVVVANGKKTIEIARKYANKILIDEGKGKGIALNRAVKSASSDILYFIDADSIIEKDTIEKVCSLGEFDGATGYNVPENRSGIITYVASLYGMFQKIFQRGLYSTSGTTVVTGRNFAIRKSVLREVGGFTNALTEDLHLSMRLMKAGARIKFVDAACYEQVPRKFSWYLLQQQRWNSGAGAVFMEWAKSISARNFAAMAFMLLIGLLPVVSLFSLAASISTMNYIFIALFLLCAVLCFRTVAMLRPADVLLFPLTFAFFILVNTATFFYSAARKPKSFYKTPKPEL